MKPASDNDVWSVGEWLAIATLDLIAPARERIKVEIEAHYADAVKSRMADGLTQEDAEAATLLALGDPFAAGRSFRQRHLTLDDERWLGKWLQSCRNRAMPWRFWVDLFNCLMMGVVFWSVSCQFQRIPFHLNWAAMLALIIYGTYVIARLRFRFLVRHSTGKFGFAPELLLLEPMSMAILILFFAMATHWITLRQLAIAFVIIGSWARKRFSLRRKLRYTQSSGDQGLAA